MSDVKEKRLIDADALKEIALKRGYSVRIDKYTGRWPCLLVADIANVPTVDAVEVVRCAECKYSFQTEDGMVRCSFHSERNDFDDRGSSYNVWMEPTDFCSYGERRIDE